MSAVEAEPEVVAVTDVVEPSGLVITEPGVYPDVSDVDYHCDPTPNGSLSRSGAMRLLPPYTPAQFKYEQDHPRPTTKAFDEGHAAHKLVLGSGPEIVEIPFDSMRTNAAKAFDKEVRANGGIPLKAESYQMVHDMADALRAHPVASALLNPERGRPEQSLFWTDSQTGVTLRARLDWLPEPTPGGRLIVPDYKTAKSADPWQFARSAADYGYVQQDPWYIDGLRALGVAEDIAFVFIVQQKTAPYLVSIVQLKDEDRSLGRGLNRQAINTYAECTRTGNWPGYPDITVVDLPSWYRIQNGA